MSRLRYLVDHNGLLVSISKLDGCLQEVLPGFFKERTHRVGKNPQSTGHSGERRMYETMQKTFFWQLMMKDSFSIVITPQTHHCVWTWPTAAKGNQKHVLYCVYGPLVEACKSTRAIPTSRTMITHTATTFPDHRIVPYGRRPRSSDEQRHSISDQTFRGALPIPRSEGHDNHGLPYSELRTCWKMQQNDSCALTAPCSRTPGYIRAASDFCLQPSSASILRVVSVQSRLSTTTTWRGSTWLSACKNHRINPAMYFHADCVAGFRQKWNSWANKVTMHSSPRKKI